MVDLDAVGRGEHAAAGGRYTSKLADSLRRVLAMLQNLGAENEVEATRRERDVLDEPDHVGLGRRDDIESHVFARDIGEEGEVRFHTAADVEYPHAPSRTQFLRLRAEPAREGRTHDPGGRRGGRAPSLLPRPVRARRW